MPLSRKTKALILWRLNPLFLLKTSIALLVLVGLFQVASLVSLLLEHSLPQFPYGLLFIPLVALQGFRWWAIAQGWSAVCIHELNMSSLQEQLQEEQGEGTEKKEEHPLGLHVQQALAEAVKRKGWMSWADVIEATQAAGMPLTKPHTSVFLGGHRSRIARPKDWKKVLNAEAWRAGQLEAALPMAHADVRPRARF